MNNFVNYGNRRAISGKSKNSAVENHLWKLLHKEYSKRVIATTQKIPTHKVLVVFNYEG
jgi:hypothetical protein